MRYGKTFFVGWTAAPRRLPTAVDVTLKSILIRQADPNPALADPSGAHWVLYLDISGYWQLLNVWAPRLATHVVGGERIVINRTVRIYVPPGDGLWVQTDGRECDEPAGVTVLGIYAHLLYPCPANTDEIASNPLDLFNNDDTGTILDTYSSVAVALGSHVSTSVATTTRFPGSGPITLGDGKQGQGAYRFATSSAHISRPHPSDSADGAGAGAPGGRARQIGQGARGGPMSGVCSGPASPTKATS